jgi:hypothetical protein
MPGRLPLSDVTFLSLGDSPAVARLRADGKYDHLHLRKRSACGSAVVAARAIRDHLRAEESQPSPPTLLERRRAQCEHEALALLMGTHPRCGASSPIFRLPPELVQGILRHHREAHASLWGQRRHDQESAGASGASIVLGGSVQIPGRNYSDFW